MINNMVIRSIRWDITDKCNLACKHCYTQQLLCPDLQFKDVITIINKIIPYGLREMNFSGREPTLYENMFDVARWCCDYGLRVNMTTNGTAISKADYDPYLALPLNMLIFSLDGASPMIHNRIRGSGNFKKTVKNIRYCCEKIKENGYQTKLGVSFTLQKNNLCDTKKIVHICHTLGVDLLAINPVSVCGAVVSAKRDLYVPPANILNCWNTICKEYSENGFKYKLYLGTFPMEAKWLNAKFSCNLPVIHTGCSAGKTLYINPHGKALPCYMLPSMLNTIPNIEPYLKYWNILDDSAEVAYEQFRPFIEFTKNYSQKDLKGCIGCPDLQVCRRCPLIVLSDPDVLYRCHLARQMLTTIYPNISANSVIALKPNVTWKITENILLLNIHDGDYFARKQFELDEYAKLMWMSIIDRNTISKIEQSIIVKTGNFEHPALRDHLTEFINYLWKDGIIDIYGQQST